VPGMLYATEESCLGLTVASIQTAESSQRMPRRWRCVPRIVYDSLVTTYNVENFGCRATQADGAALALQFEARGLASADAAVADIVLLNTCTVTAAADQDARAAIRRVRRQNPAARIIVTGCYAQRAPEEVAALPGVSAVVGNSHKHQLASLILEEKSGRASSFVPISALIKSKESATENQIFVSDIFAHTELLAAPVFESSMVAEGGRTRPNLKVQDGCDNRCSFCIIPSVRGHSRSLSLEQVVRQVNMLVDAGYREAVISGINLGRWGRDLPGGSQPAALGANGQTSTLRFETLVHTILNQTRIEKLRISSVEPMDWSDDLINLVASSPRIAKHAHVPLQSGSDQVLRRMHRKYRPWHYREKIEKIRAAIPTAAIGADVMTGFPGETDAEFESTRRLIEDLPFTYLHVFTYSSRPGTPAANLRNQVPVEIARERNGVLRELATQKKRLFMESFLGKTIEAITLRTDRGDFTEALSDNYQKLYLKGRQEANRWLEARMESIEGGALLGTVVG
jgi:threonylcarbamoyladenosine tRNA methylthiotransferase MtaB